MEPVDDSALLRQFAENHSDEAFAELVARHVNLVYSVALRQVGHPQNAEEITQAVFIILAKKAAGLRHEKALSSWLFQATRFTAINFVRSEIRRQNREQEAQMQTILNESGGEVWPKIAPLLDDAVAALREKERRAIVLRFYEGRSLREVGLALGASEDAAKKRVGRALEKLRQSFAKRGVDSTTAAIAETISANSVLIAPVALAKTATAVALAKGAAASTSTLTLIKGALKIMAWTKAKTAIVVGAVVLAAAGGSTIVIEKLEHKHTEFPTNAVQQFVQTSGGAISMEGVKFITSLKLKGQLPGIVSNTPAQMEIPWISFDRPGSTAHYSNTNLSFPVSLTLTVHANDVNERYHYTVTKAAETNEWQLQKAWRADTNGIILNEYPVP